MTCYVFRRRRRVAGEIHESREWFGALRMDWDVKERVWCLGTADRREAERLLHAERITAEKRHHGLIPPHEYLDAQGRSLDELLGAFLSDRRDHGRSSATLKKYRNLRVMFGRCGWTKLASVTARSFLEWRKRSTLSRRSLNDLLRNTRTFFHWMRRARMVALDPLEFVELLPEVKDRRYRRAGSPDEIRRLLAVLGRMTDVTGRPEKQDGCAASAPPGPASTARQHDSANGLTRGRQPIVRSTGKERAAVYLLVANSGLRRGELQGLAVDDFVFDTPSPFVRVRPSIAKNRKEAIIPLRADVVDAVRAVLPAHPAPAQRAFAGMVPRLPRFKKDLALANIPFETAEGRFDFHSLRLTFCTNLSAAGVAPRVAMELMRHSDIRLTMKVYTDPARLPLAAAVASLPALTSPEGVNSAKSVEFSESVVGRTETA